MKVPNLLIRVGLFFCILVISVSGSLAQKTAVYSQPDAIYHDALEYYQKKQYTPARSLFEQYLKKGTSDIKQNLSSYYVLLCGVKNGLEKDALELEKLLRRDGNNVMSDLSWFELGIFYFDAGKYKKAARMFEQSKIASLSTDEWQEANFKIGYAYFAIKEYETAKKYLGQARTREGTFYIPANYYYGYICYVQQDWKCALSSFDKLDGKGPKNIGLFRAQIFYAQKQYPKSLETAKPLLEDDKLREDAILLSAKCHYQLGNYKQVIEQVEKYGVPLDQMESDDLFQFGNAYFELKNYEKAFPYFVRLSGLDNDLGQLSNYNLGYCFIQLMKKQNAFNAFSEAKRMSHNKEIQEVAFFQHAKLAFELGYQNIAVQAVNDFIEKYPNSEYGDEAKGILAESFLRTKNYKQAIVILDEIKNPNFASKKAYQQVAFNRALELYLNKEFTEAVRFFDKSFKYPINKKIEAEAYFWKGEIAFQNKDFSEAIRQYNLFVNVQDAQKSKLYNTAFYSMGYCYFSRKEYALALNYFKKYRDQEVFYGKAPTRYIDNMLRLADCYFIQRQYTQAAESYGYVAMKNYPGSDYAIFQQGMIYGLQGNPAMKVSTLKKLVREYKSSIYMDDALFEMANTYMSRNEYKNAEDLLNQLISQHDASPFIANAYLQLGLIYYNQNMDNRAIAYYKTVIEKYPRSKEAEEALKFIELIYVNSGRGDEYLEFVGTIPNSGLRLTYQDSLLYESGMVKYREGDCQTASKTFLSYINRFGDKGYFIIPVNYYLAECEWFYGDKNKATTYYNYVTRQPRSEFSEKSLLKLSSYHYDRKELKTALGYYVELEKTATSKGNYVLALVGEMRCNYGLGNKDAAKKNAIDILPIENISKEYAIEANFILGKIQFEDANYLTALYHLNYVITESKNVLGAESQYLKANIFYKQNKLDSAANAVFDLNDRFSPYEIWVVKGFVLLADIYVAEKDYFQARATLQSILDEYDGDPSIIQECKKKMQEIERLEKGDAPKSNEESEDE